MQAADKCIMKEESSFKIIAFVEFKVYKKLWILLLIYSVPATLQKLLSVIETLQNFSNAFRNALWNMLKRMLLKPKIWHSKSQMRRSSKKVFLKMLQKITRKHLRQSLFRKVAGLRRRCFPVNFRKFSRTPFS